MFLNAAEISAFIKVFEIKKGSNSVGNNRRRKPALEPRWDKGFRHRV